MSKPLLDFAGMIRALGDPETCHDADQRAAALLRFKREITAMLVMLQSAKVIGRNETPHDPPTVCALCGVDPIVNGMYVSGAIKSGGRKIRAVMCSSCFEEHGLGVGWGVGQIYVHNGLSWQCIGGGNPDPSNEALPSIMRH